MVRFLVYVCRYMEGAGKDGGYTEPGTWMSFNEERSITAICEYVKRLGLGGAFAFDTSMDTVAGGQWTYKLMNTMADVLGKPHPNPSPAPAPPSPGPGPVPPSPGPPTPPPAPPAPGHCRALVATVTDAWCEENCHAKPPFCPPQDCLCSPA